MNNPPIGVGITTHNRRPMLKRTLSFMRKFTPLGVPIVIVDDGSDDPFPDADHRNDTPQGVANAKNHCLRLLTGFPHIQHLFLFDDDCHPTAPNWWQPYVESGEHHLAYLHDNQNPGAHAVVYDDGKIAARVRGTACMLYFTRHCIETVGGFRPDYGRWGFEHDDLTHRIMNAGLTRFPYQGLSRQRGIWNLDEYEHGRSSVSSLIRAPLYPHNKALFEQHRWSRDFVPYK